MRSIEDKIIAEKIDPIKVAKEYINQQATEKIKKDIMTSAIR